MHFRIVRTANGGLEFGGTVLAHELAKIDLSVQDHVLLRKASVPGPTQNEDALTVLSTLYRRYREMQRK